MAQYSVVFLTAAPPGQAAEAGGAFVKIDGREALLRSVELFLNRDDMKQFQLCFLPEDAEEAKRKYSAHLSFSGVKVVTGGPKWIDQLAASAANISADCSHVILHDAARPAVPFSDIDRLLEEADKHAAVILASPGRTELVEVDEGGNALALHRAERFMHLLTPQVFSREKFQQMASSKQPLHPSELRIVKGSPLNVRIAGPGDTTLLKAMLNLLPKPKVKAPSNPFEEAQW